jgi:hypothetical protein
LQYIAATVGIICFNFIIPEPEFGKLFLDPAIPDSEEKLDFWIIFRQCAAYKYTAISGVRPLVRIRKKAKKVNATSSGPGC